jgi:hypothetical protein
MEIFKEVKDIDHELIVKESKNIIEQVGWNNDQICLQYSDEVSWHNDVDYYGKHRNENECVNYHPDLDNTYIKQILSGLNFPVASARLMLLNKLGCYSTHVDLFTRYHIPIESNSRLSYMVFPDIPFVARMSYGKIYWTNTYELHTFVNGDHSPRIHIIFNNADEIAYYDNPYIKELYGDRFT